MGMKAVAGGAAMMATGICIMHYSGMHAMKMQPGIIWNPVLVATTALIAFLGSGVALWLVFHLRRITSRRQLLARTGAALVMGLAVVGPATAHGGELLAQFDETARQSVA